uniref:Uncharacterized protein n=1 Tax=viral metagenome TaxID=1070528 RepID=A0A6C0HT42_9ZZZZ
MSSLVTSASPWMNDDSTNKKRQSTMRKTIKLRSDNQTNSNQNKDFYEENNVGDVSGYDETTLESEKYGKMSPATINDQVQYNNTRNNRVNELLDKITSTDKVSDNNKMGDFKPMTPPSLNIKKGLDTTGETKQYIPPMPSYLKATIDRSSVSNGGQVSMSYGLGNGGANIYSNYQNSYEPPAKMNNNRPYYAAMGIGGGSGNDKMMEKINYLIHLMEENQNERTANITEEFILYTFLGVFVIFVVDSFSRSGKYVR